MSVFTLAAVGATPRASVIQTQALRGVIGFENLDAVQPRLGEYECSIGRKLGTDWSATR